MPASQCGALAIGDFGPAGTPGACYYTPVANDTGHCQAAASHCPGAAGPKVATVTVVVVPLRPGDGTQFRGLSDPPGRAGVHTGVTGVIGLGLGNLCSAVEPQ